MSAVDVSLVILAFVTLGTRRVPPIVVVAASALAGQLLAG